MKWSIATVNLFRCLFSRSDSESDKDLGRIDLGRIGFFFYGGSTNEHGRSLVSNNTVVVGTTTYCDSTAVEE